MLFNNINKSNMYKKNKYDGGIKLFLLFIIILICYAESLTKSHYANFDPMNGTFRNYNPIRRFLDGQIPFLDFYDYLGLGHMYSGVFVSLFMGNTYQNSLVIFEFLTIICFSLVIGKCIFKKYITASIFTIAILFATMNFESFGSLNDLRSVLTPGNSARLIRGMCLPLSTIIFLLCVKNWYLIKKLLSKLNDSEIIAILVGITSGISILWSNDYVFSAVGAITLLASVQFILPYIIIN